MGKKTSLKLLALGIFLFLVPTCIDILPLDQYLSNTPGSDAGLAWVAPILACWTLGIIVALFGIVGFICSLFKKTAIRGLCKRCGYKLKGLTEPRCPECGTAFDPEDRDVVSSSGGRVDGK